MNKFSNKFIGLFMVIESNNIIWSHEWGLWMIKILQNTNKSFERNHDSSSQAYSFNHKKSVLSLKRVIKSYLINFPYSLFSDLIEIDEELLENLLDSILLKRIYANISKFTNLKESEKNKEKEIWKKIENFNSGLYFVRKGAIDIKLFAQLNYGINLVLEDLFWIGLMLKQHHDITHFNPESRTSCTYSFHDNERNG